VPAAPPLTPATLHLWRLRLDLPDSTQATLADLLAPDEAARAARFHFERDRRHFAAARGQLRQVLAAYTGDAPAALLLAADAHGKPYLARAPRPLHFNLAHSGAWALVAVSAAQPVGADIEFTGRALDDRASIARRFFAPGEAQRLAALPEAEQPEAFFRIWTRKEAYVKARGEGLALALDSFEVSLEPDAPRLLWVAGDAAEPGRWTFFAPALPDGYVGAVAVRATGVRLSECGEWRPEVMASR
jgi:4'-phosphopantetheinyl transferase